MSDGTGTFGQSSNKYTPREDDIEGQIMQIALLPASDINFLSQMLNLLSFSEKARKRYTDFIIRENKKRWFFSSGMPTHILKDKIAEYDDIIKNFDTSLTEDELKYFSAEEQKTRKEQLENEFKSMEEQFLKMREYYNNMNKEIEALGLIPIDKLDVMVKKQIESESEQK